MSTGKAEDSGTAVYVISVAAELSGMHAQTLRTYDRMGLVTPARTSGGGRRYSRRDITMLQRIQHLSQEEGVNLNGIQRILELQRRIAQLDDQVEQLSATVRRMQAMAYEDQVDPRVFTAESTGRVHLGRKVIHAQLALPGRHR